MIETTGNETSGFRLTPQLLLGLLVATVGMLLTLDRLGYLYADDYIRFWPAGLIAIGGLKLWQSRGGSGAMMGLVFVAAGIWLLLEEMTSLRIHIDDLWPLLLVVVGGYLVWQGLSTRATSNVQPDGRSTISAMAVLGAVTRGSSSRTFRGGDLTAILGGCELDLRASAIDGEAVVDVFALWGGIEIRVPDDWAVDSRVFPLLGSVEQKTEVIQGPAVHRLVVRGFAVMSGVEIRN
jgi:hypothetical protein